MIRFLSTLALMLSLCSCANADLNILIDFYDVGTVTPVTQPIPVGQSFDMVLSVQDTVGTGVSAVLFEWFFDNALLDQGASLQLAPDWTNLGSSTNADGGTIEAFSFVPPTPPDAIVEVARIDYLAMAEGTATFTTAGTGNPAAATFVTFDGRGFFPDGSCNPASATPCDGEVVQFGAGQITLIPAGPDGDFNDDGRYDCADVDALVAEIAAGTNNPGFDLTGDGAVNTDDLDAWLVEGGANNPAATGGNAFLYGDATLDGVVDGLDFIQWNTDKFTSTAKWCAADFNADGTVDGLDFIVWNENKFTSADHATVVPEAGGMTLVLLAAVACLARGRRESSEFRVQSSEFRGQGTAGDRGDSRGQGTSFSGASGRGY